MSSGLFCRRVTGSSAGPHVEGRRRGGEITFGAKAGRHAVLCGMVASWLVEGAPSCSGCVAAMARETGRYGDITVRLLVDRDSRGPLPDDEHGGSYREMFDIGSEGARDVLGRQTPERMVEQLAHYRERERELVGQLGHIRGMIAGTEWARDAVAAAERAGRL